MANRVVHFEIEAKDKQRAKKFYSSVFDWKMDEMPMGQDYNGYVVIKTGENTGKPEDMGIDGGMYQADKDKEVNAFRCVVSVDDVRKSMEDVKTNGGKVLHGPDDIPGVGLYALCQDTEDNYFGLLQPSPDMTAQK